MIPNQHKISFQTVFNIIILLKLRFSWYWIIVQICRHYELLITWQWRLVGDVYPSFFIPTGPYLWEYINKPNRNIYIFTGPIDRARTIWFHLLVNTRGVFKWRSKIRKGDIWPKQILITSRHQIDWFIINNDISEPIYVLTSYAKFCRSCTTDDKLIGRVL